MKTAHLSFDLNALAKPQTHEDFMALAAEALTEIRRFRELFARAMEDAPQSEATR